jgi:hypothetical protein
MRYSDLMKVSYVIICQSLSNPLLYSQTDHLLKFESIRNTPYIELETSFKGNDGIQKYDRYDIEEGRNLLWWAVERLLKKIEQVSGQELEQLVIILVLMINYISNNLLPSLLREVSRLILANHSSAIISALESELQSSTFEYSRRKYCIEWYLSLQPIKPKL